MDEDILCAFNEAIILRLHSRAVAQKVSAYSLCPSPREVEDHKERKLEFIMWVHKQVNADSPLGHFSGPGSLGLAVRKKSFLTVDSSSKY